MKKKIFVNIILFLEFVLLGICAASHYTSIFDSMVPFNYVLIAGEWCLDKLNWLADLIYVRELFTMLIGQDMPFVSLFLTLTAVNIAWIIVFYIIFGIIGAIIKASKTKKRRRLVSEYKLTPSEEKRFVPANYKKKTGRWVGWTMIIPILAIAVFVFARFDVRNILAWEPKINNEYGMDIYWKGIIPVLDTILDPIKVDNYIQILFTNGSWGYFDLINKYLVSVPHWLEYVILAVAGLLILFVWWGIFKLISLIFRNAGAKCRCRKAKKAYIEKMEKTEYKLRKKYKDDSIAKGDEFLRIIEEEQSEDAQEIAKIKEEKSKRHLKKIDARKKAYLEEIGYGVTDLGVSDEIKETKEPIVEREIRYISDADVDIILDEEPVIEIVEEDDMEEVELANKEDDLFFEKYHDDDVDLELVEVNKTDPSDVMDYVKEKAEEKETPIVETAVEEAPTEEPVIEEYVEEPVEEVAPVDEETPAVEETAPVVEETPVEEPKKNDPFAAYRNRVNKGHGAKKVQTFKEAGFKEDEMMVRDDGVKVSIKYDPFAKWRNQERKKGYGAKKVPSFKEIQAQKEAEAKKAQEAKAVKQPAKPASKKPNPFEAYKNKPKASTAAKKVPAKSK